MRWEDIYNYLINYYPKPTVSRAKSDLIDEGIIKEIKTVEGKKITLIREPIEFFENEKSGFSEECFRSYHEEKIRYYFKIKLAEDHNWAIFDVGEYMRLTGDLEVKDYIISYPFEVRKVISDIYCDVYNLIFGENPNVMVRFRNVGNYKKLSEISSRDVGKLVEFDGLIIQASRMKSRVVVAAYQCPKCGSKKVMELGLWDDPEKVGKNLTCPRDNCDSKYMMYKENESIHANFQELLIQQPLELSVDGRQHTMIVFIEGHDEGIYSGNVKIVGVPIKKRKRGASVSDIYIYGIYCEKIDKQDFKLTEEDIIKIKKVAEDKDVIRKLANAMFREIQGHEDIKKAIFLQQIKGVKKTMKRPDINILLITDPGIGKTTIMKRLEMFPNNKYVSMTTATGAGLSASVVREKTEFGESWVVKPGALVLADGGTVAIDEIGVNKDAMKHILEAMESQTIHINKGGIDAILPARCAVLGACNPKYGSFNPDLSVWEQIDLPTPLLSRFDLIFPIMDVPDKTEDEKIAEHIIDFGNKDVMGIKDKIVINGVEITDEFLVKYIMYARQLRPIIGDDAKRVIIDFYTKMREVGKKKGIKTITARQLESLIRISEAIAKAKLKETVDKEDAEEAIDLMMKSLKQIAYDPDEGEIDVDKIVGVPKKEREKLDVVINTIKELSNNEPNVLVKFDDIKEVVSRYNIDEVELKRLLDKLRRLGDIDEPKPFKYRLL
jgi:replicative DNA helicase Mcm